MVAATLVSAVQVAIHIFDALIPPQVFIPPSASEAKCVRECASERETARERERARAIGSARESERAKWKAVGYGSCVKSKLGMQLSIRIFDALIPPQVLPTNI